MRGAVNAARQIRVLVVDDDARFAAALLALFADSERIEVVGIASDGEDAIRAALRLRPDVVTMDLEMPRMDGIEATRRILAVLPRTRVVLVSGSEHADRAEPARRAGASAYVTKSRVADDLARTIEAAAAGEEFAPSEGCRPGT